MPSKKHRLRVVIDTSALVSALWGGIYLQIIHLWKSGHLQLIVSADIVEEYLRVLAKLGVQSIRLEGWAKWFRHPSKVTVVRPGTRFQVCRDANDNMFLDAAVAGKAKCNRSGLIFAQLHITTNGRD
jgi:putative PIN family toxin of toxin-antitoxin system